MPKFLFASVESKSVGLGFVVKDYLTPLKLFTDSVATNDKDGNGSITLQKLD